MKRAHGQERRTPSTTPDSVAALPWPGSMLTTFARDVLWGEENVTAISEANQECARHRGIKPKQQMPELRIPPGWRPMPYAP